MRADWDIVKSVASAGLDGLKSAFTGFFDWLKQDINWLLSFVPGDHKISGSASDIPGFSRAYGGSTAAFGHGATVGYPAGVTKQSMIDDIRATAIAKGIDPNIAVRVAASEGLSGYTGDHGMSHGPFQLYSGGGLGNIYSRLYGESDLTHPTAASIHKQIEFSLDYASRTGSWAPWHGARRVGIGAHEGFGMHHVLGRPQHESVVPPARPVHVTVISPVHLDGRIISKNTERHLVHRHQFAHGTADHDGRAGMPAVDYMSIA